MSKELLDLMDSMTDGYIQDMMHEFDLDTEAQAIKLIRESLERVEEEL